MRADLFSVLQSLGYPINPKSSRPPPLAELIGAVQDFTEFCHFALEHTPSGWIATAERVEGSEVETLNGGYRSTAELAVAGLWIKLKLLTSTDGQA